MESTASFIEDLVRVVPELKALYDEHCANNDMLLPHVFMGDVARFVIAQSENSRSGLSVATLLRHVESGLKTGSDDVQELVVVSFVENLIGETTALEALKPLMGPNLRVEVERLCG